MATDILYKSLKYKTCPLTGKFIRNGEIKYICNQPIVSHSFVKDITYSQYYSSFHLDYLIFTTCENGHTINNEYNKTVDK